ncbi:DUF1129 family protein [Paenibacillus harenae]|uniref:DNA-binding ferritin-like protein (Dps family) n=1 Tax=Paenibacillus harenae TaxID=306543 RepID=A0ABT9U7K5_PAEHA|nr:DUF1129 family protein [Paenibacillus harenae]MDQ0115016.1 DNA-binding ferritin-like protein (Dps family) [Paenibacillus harenae]
MNAKDLIQLNNQKRKELTKENEEYYGNMLVYIRSHVSISEQQSEDLLMELLDHLLEAQAEGKRAEDVFGENLAAYCDEIIKQLPKEKSKITAFFIGFLLFQLVGWMALGEGAVDIALRFFKDIDHTVYLGTALVSFLISAVIIFLAVYLILKWVQQSVYKELNKMKDFVLLFFIAVIFIIGIIFLPRLVPPFGYAIEFGGYVYLIGGVAIIYITKWLDRKYRITK